MAAHWNGTRMRIPMLRTSAAVLALGFLSAPVMAGEFFTGTRSNSSRFESTRTSVGQERLSATRNFTNKINGSSHKHFINVSASAENARLGSRSFGFLEGEAEISQEAQGVVAGGIDTETVTTTEGGGLLSGLFSRRGGGGSTPTVTVETTADGNIAGAAASEADIQVDGMAGTGHERYLDGSLNASAEWGGARTHFNLSENGNSQYKMQADFSEISTEDGTRSSGGSVFSFN